VVVGKKDKVVEVKNDNDKNDNDKNDNDKNDNDKNDNSFAVETKQNR
jgi:hypothetical protein